MKLNLQSSALLRVVLGNPKQECKYFGICRLELWDGRPLLENECVARCAAFYAKSRKLQLLFLKNYLSNALYAKHFHPFFLVPFPCELPAFMLSLFIGAGTGAIPGIIIKPGEYDFLHVPQGICVTFNLEELIVEHAQSAQPSSAISQRCS